jgi:hypothetical protein
MGLGISKPYLNDSTLFPAQTVEMAVNEIEAQKNLIKLIVYKKNLYFL